MKPTNTLPAYPYELPLIVDADDEGNIVRVTLFDYDITARCLINPTLWGDLQTYAYETMRDAADELDREHQAQRRVAVHGEWA